MNWLRGLLRIWVVFSAIWILAFVLYAALNWSDFTTSEYEVKDPNGHIYTATGPSSATPTEALAAVELAVKERQPEMTDLAEKLTAADAAGRTSEAKQIAKRYAAVRDAPIELPRTSLWKLLLFALGMPGLLLAAGATVRWIAKGFRANP